MSKMIQIRNVPDELHRELKVKAARAGMSLSDYLLKMAEREVNKLSLEELMERVKARGRIGGDFDSAAIVRQAREERAAHIERLTSW